MGKLIVHHLKVSQSDRVSWLCEELGLDYELKLYDRAPLFAPDEYKKLHPIGSAPVIEDGNVKLAESEACLEYIAHYHANGRFFVKPGEKGFVDFVYWYHLANGTLQPAIMRRLTLELAGVGKGAVAKAMDAKRDQVLAYIDQRLSEVHWLAGEEFSAADIMTVFSLTVMRCFQPYSLGDFPNILKYLKRVSERPGYQRARQKGDPELDVQELIGANPPPLHKALG